MPHINIPAQQIIALLNKQTDNTCQPNQRSVVINLKESKQSEIIIWCYLDDDSAIHSIDINLIEQGYNGDDDISVVDTDYQSIVNHINSYLTEAA